MEYEDPTQHRIWDRYLQRPKLYDDRAQLIRLRVAIQVVNRLYRRVEHRVPERAFPDWCIRVLAERTRAGHPHPLQEEIEDVLGGWKRGETSADTYHRECSFSADRIINRLKYGGRRG